MVVTSFELLTVFGVLTTVGVLGQDLRGLSASFNDRTRPSATSQQIAALRQQRLNQPISRSQEFFRNNQAVLNTRQTMINSQRRQSGSSVRDISRPRRLQMNSVQQMQRNMQLLSQPAFRQQQAIRQQELQQRKQQQELLQRRRLQLENSVGTSNTRRNVPQEQQRFSNLRGANRISTQEQSQRQRPLLVSGSDNSRRGGVILSRLPFRFGPPSQDQLRRLAVLNNRSPGDVRNLPRPLEEVAGLEEQQRQLHHRRLEGRILQQQENQKAREAGTMRYQMLLNTNGEENRPLLQELPQLQQPNQQFIPTTSLENFQKLAAENEKESLLVKREKIYNLVKLLGFEPTDLLNIVATLEAHKRSQGPIEQTSMGSFSNRSLLSDTTTQTPPVTGQMFDPTNHPKVVPNELIPVLKEPNNETNKTHLATSEPSPGNTHVTRFNFEPTLELVNATPNLEHRPKEANYAVKNSTLSTNGSVDSTNSLQVTNPPYTTNDPSLATIQPYLATNETNQNTNQPASFTTQLMHITTEPTRAVSEQNNVRHTPISSESKNVQAPSNRFDVSIILGMKNADTTAAPINNLTEAVRILEVWNGSFPDLTIPEAANDTLLSGSSTELANSTVEMESFLPAENKTKAEGVFAPGSLTYRYSNATDGFGTFDARTGPGDFTRYDMQNLHTMTAGILQNATKNATMNAIVNAADAGPTKDDILMIAGKMLIMELLGLSESTSNTNSLVSDTALIHNITRIISSLTARIPVYTSNNEATAAVDTTLVNVNITPASEVNISSMIRRLGLANDQSKMADTAVNNVQLADSLLSMKTHQFQQNPEMTSVASVANYTDTMAVPSFPENNNFTFTGSESQNPYSALPQTELHGGDENLPVATAIARMYGIPIEEAMIMLNIPDLSASGEPNKNTTSSIASNDTRTKSVPATNVHYHAFSDLTHDTTSPPNAVLQQGASNIMYLSQVSQDAAQVTTPLYQAYGEKSPRSTLATLNSSQEGNNNLQTPSMNLTEMSQDKSPARGSSDTNVVLVWKSAAANTNTLPSLTDVHNDSMSSDNLLETNRHNPYNFDSSLAKDGFLSSPGAFPTIHAPQTMIDKSLLLETEGTRIKLGTESLLTSFSRIAKDISSNVIKPQPDTGHSGDPSLAVNGTSLNPPALTVNSSDVSATSNTSTQQGYNTTTTVYSFN